MEMTVQDLLAVHPQAASVLISLKTDCVGCSMERFCTLADVAQAYNLPLPSLREALHAFIQTAGQESGS
jgi:hybrid cluster-associated redox disulfide protein